MTLRNIELCPFLTYKSKRAGVSTRAVNSQCFFTRSVVNIARPTRTCSIISPPLTPPTMPLDCSTYQSNRAGVSIGAVYSQCFITRSVVNRARPTRTCSISPPPLTPPPPLRPWTLSLTKVTEQVSPSGLSTPNVLSLVLLWIEHGLHAPALSAPLTPPPGYALGFFHLPK